MLPYAGSLESLWVTSITVWSAKSIFLHAVLHVQERGSELLGIENGGHLFATVRKPQLPLEDSGVLEVRAATRYLLQYES